MAKFCKNCGKMLEEGAVCDCTTAAAPTAPEAPVVPEAPVAPVAPAAPAAPKEGIGTFFKKIWGLFVSLVKKPVTTATAFVNSCDYKTALGLIAICSVAVGLLLVSFAGEFNALIEEMAGSRVDDEDLFPALKIFFVGAIGTFGIGALLPAVLMMFTKIFKKETNYKYMLCASGINSLTITPFVLAGLVLSLICGIDPRDVSDPEEAMAMITWALFIPLMLSTIGNTLGNYITMKSLRAGSSLTEDNTPYVMFFTGLVMSIAISIVIYIGFPMCLPEALEDMGVIDIFERLF